LTGGNRNDVTQLIPLLEAVPPVRGKHGRPRRRPDLVLGDRGYDHDKYRRLVWDLGVKSSRLGCHRGSSLSGWVSLARPLNDGSRAKSSSAMNHVSLSVFRFDDDALVTPHLARLVGHDSPLMHLRRHGDAGMFSRFAEHAEELWSGGVPIPELSSAASR
jgi:hypothetical protein